MASERKGGRRQADYHHERPPDPQEESDRPLEDKDRRREDEGRDPHHGLTNPVGEPDPDSDADPYEPGE